MTLFPPFPIYNPCATDDGRTFDLFCALPKELRVAIWNLVLCRPRIIRLHISRADFENPATIRDVMATYTSIEETASKSGGEYLITMDGFKVLSKFLRVCKESREEALKFYRVHIPCRFVRSPGANPAIFGVLVKATFDDKLDSTIAPGIFYFNPEWDFLRITCWPHTKALLPPFFHDLKTRYDSRGVGLRNLIISEDDQYGSGSIDSIQPSEMQPSILQSFQQTLHGLCNVYFHQELPFRVNLSWSMGARSGETWFDRSLPISTVIPTFELCPNDSRPIAGDLERQWMGHDWRNTHVRFTNLMSRFVSPPQKYPANIKFMISYRATLKGDMVNSRDQAEKWLEKDYQAFWVDRKWWGRREYEAFEDQEYIMECKPAFGFWLFPLEATTAALSAGSDCIWDMRLHPPELGLAYMP
ncbi:hypothetical protein BKA63DRAFT_523833 [Paraphoma chrysanthemicola]|nr:hypothetical protein BKA63DRAFT_523833 [Paraphoma chrysanthemicola]